MLGKKLKQLFCPLAVTDWILLYLGMCMSELKPLIGPERMLSGVGLNEVIHKALSAANYYPSLLSQLHSLFRFHSLIDACGSHNSSVRAPLSWHMYRLMLIKGAQHTLFFWRAAEVSSISVRAVRNPDRTCLAFCSVHPPTHTPTPCALKFYQLHFNQMMDQREKSKTASEWSSRRMI